MTDLNSEAPKCKGTAFPAKVDTHIGRVQIAEVMKTHTDLVENAGHRVDNQLPFPVTSYQAARRKRPDWKPSLWNQFVREQENQTYFKGIKEARSEVDSRPPDQAMRYSNRRKGYRKKMEKKGIKQTKATEIMWSWQEEQDAKFHLKRHALVIKQTPACVDHHPPVKAMQHRKWKRKTDTTYQVDAPLPRPRSARFVKWKSTFDGLNLSMKGVTKADLEAPLLDLRLPFEDGFDELVIHDTGASPSQVPTEPASEQASDGTVTGDDEFDGSEDEFAEELELNREPPVEAWQASPSNQRPQSQQSGRTGGGFSHATASSRTRPSSQQSERTSATQSLVHNGLPSRYSAGLKQAYMGAASNDDVRKLLLKAQRSKSGHMTAKQRRPTTAS